MRASQVSRRIGFCSQLLLIASCAPIIILPPHALALPAGGTVVSGNVVMTTPSAGRMDLTQTGNAAIMNWSDFSIGAGETVNISQAANAALLNRVTGVNMSQLLGQLNADGRVFLINPNGVVVGAGATINVQEFIASTQDVADAEFLDFINGDSSSLRFEGTSSAGVTNLGTITAANGDVILVGYRVDNAGTINAANGVVGLAAGRKVWLRPQNAQHLIIESTVHDAGADAADGTGVANSGDIAAIQAELKAAAGNVYALAINQTGMISATGVANRNGRILLTTDEGTVALTSGTLTARNADGSGGEVLVGGDYHGLDPDSDDNGVHLAASTTVGAGAVIDVSASAADADGGRAVVWSGGLMTNTGTTTFAGTINAGGGASGGAGGFVVVAGHDGLDYSGTVDVGAPAGETGTLVLGLPNANIANVAVHDTANGIISNAALSTLLGSANVVVDAFGSWTDDDAGSILVNGNLAWNSANQLTLKSGHYLRVGADINAPDAAIEFQVMGVDTVAERDSVYTSYGTTITADRLTVGQNADSEFIGFNPPPEAARYTGFFNFQGAVKVGTLDLKIENAGLGRSDTPFEGEINGAINMFFAGNEIGEITSSVSGGAINGHINIVDSTGDLTVSADFSAMGDGANTSITTAGSLTLTGDARFAASALRLAGEEGEPDYILGSEVVLAAKGGSFINNASAGAGVISLDEHSRFLIYSDNPTDTIKGGLTASPFYGASFSNFRPRDVRDWEGSFFFYTYQPTLTFTANLSRLYGQENPTLTYTVTGLLDGDDLANAFSGAPDLFTAATASSNVGDYAITVDAGSVEAYYYNYAVEFEPGTLTVDPAPLTITANNQSMTVGGVLPAFTATYSGFVNGDTVDVVSGLLLTSAGHAGSPVGSYDIVPSAATAANYDISFVNGTLLIGAVPTLQITADSFTIRYGAAIPTLTGIISGFASGDDAGVVSGLTFSTSAVRGSPVGTYAIVPSGASADGYDILYQNGTLTIDPALLTISAANLTRLYGSANPALTVSYDGFVNGEDAGVVSGLSVSTTATAASDVGSYVIDVSGATAPNYTIVQNDGTLTVNKAPLTVTVDDFTKVYADLNPTFTASVSGFVLGQTLEDVGSLDFSNNGLTQLTAAGEHPISAGFNAYSDNYEVTIDPGTLTITRRPVTAYMTHETKVYGDPLPTIYWGMTGDPVPGLNLYNLINPAEISFTGTATQSSPVGVYVYNVSGITNPSLDVTYVPGSLTITPAPLTVRVTNRSRTYGSENPAWVTGATGLKLSDTVASVIPDITFTTAATITSNVGTYAVTPSGTVVDGNYDVTFASGTLTINKAPLTITPTLATRVYGDPDPVFTVTATGLLNGDTTSVIQMLNFNGTSSVWGVGSHPLSIVSATATNYSLTFQPGILNVTPRPLTITANNATREYGEANPVFTASFDNLASFDDASDITGLALSTVATASSGVLVTGYGINVTSNANPNYTISYEPGRLYITPAPLLVNLSNITREYGEANQTPTASVTTGLKNDDTLGMLGISFDNLAPPTADVGTFAYGASASNPNYNVAFTGGTQTITPAPLAVHVTDVFRRYGDDNPGAYTVNLEGLKFAANAADLVTITNAADFSSDTGVYPFAALLLTGNYTLAGVSGDLTVTPRLIDVVASATRRYGDANPAASAFTLTGDFVNGDQPADVVGFYGYGNPVAVSANVGDYDISSSALYLAPDSNYVVRSFEGTLTVAPRPIDINIADIERFYGDANPAFTLLGNTNLLPALDARDAVLRFTAPDQRAVPGNYTVEVEIINPNYTFGQQGFGRVSILPRPLSITVNNAARYYGDANPGFTATYGGLGLPDFVDPADLLQFGTVEATGTRANAGHYLISASPTGLDSSLYTVFNFTPGILSILPRPITLAVNDLSLVYPHGTDLGKLADFSDVRFTATATNLAQGDTVGTSFPNLVFRVLTGATAGELAAAPSPATFTPPPVAAMLADAGEPAAETGTTTSFIPIVVDGLFAENMKTSIPINTTLSFPTDFKLSTSGDVLSLLSELTLDRTVALTGGYLGANPNYAVTAVNTGVLTLRAPKLSPDEINRIDEEGVDAVLGNAPLRVRGLSEYTGNIGVLFSDYPGLTRNMITDYFAGLFESGEAADNELLATIFGEGVKGMDDIDPAAITAWLGDIDSNTEKRVLLAAPLADYVRSLQGKDPSTYTMGETHLVAAIKDQVRQERAKLAETVLEAQNAWLQQKAAAPNLADTFDGTQPYGDFIKAGVENYMVEAMNGGAIAAVVAGAGAGAAGAGGSAAAGVAITTAMFPFHYGTVTVAATAGAAASGTGAATTGASVSGVVGAPALSAAGPAAIIVAAVTMSIVRAIQLGENMKEEKDFNAITDLGGASSFANMDLNPDNPKGQALADQLVFGAALNNMLGGS